MKQRIREKGWNEYDRILKWIEHNEWSNSYRIGGMMEKLWHIIFGMPAVEYVSLFSSFPSKVVEL
jgi:hypothetical protein